MDEERGPDRGRQSAAATRSDRSIRLTRNAQFACTIRALGYTDGSGNPLWKTSTIVNIVLTGTDVFEPGIALHEFYGHKPPIGQHRERRSRRSDLVMSSPAFEVDVAHAHVRSRTTSAIS